MAKKETINAHIGSMVSPDYRILRLCLTKTSTVKARKTAIAKASPSLEPTLSTIQKNGQSDDTHEGRSMKISAMAPDKRVLVH
jgi:hypothetical protein